MLALSRQVAIGSDGTPLSYQLFGQGPTRIVLLHGLGGDSSDWVSPEMAEALDTVHATYAAIDLRGHGIDTRYPCPTRLDAALICADIAVIAETLGWEDYGLVGYSFGGVVALLHAADPHVSWSVSGGVTERTTSWGHLEALSSALLDPFDAVDGEIIDTVAFTRARRRNPTTLAQLCRALSGVLECVRLAPDRHAIVIGEDDEPESARRVAAAAGGLPTVTASGDHVSLFLSGGFLRGAFEVASRAGWIDRPVTKPSDSARVLVLSGLPGTGKTSVARAVKSLSGGERISSDELRAKLPNRDYSDGESKLIYREAFDQVVGAAQHETIVVFDATNLRADADVPDTTDAVAADVHLRGGRTVIATLDAKVETLDQRLTTRGELPRQADDFSEASPAVLKSFRRTVPPAISAHVDTELFTPEMTARIVAPLLDGRLPALAAAQVIGDNHIMQRTAVDAQTRGPRSLLDWPWTLRLFEQIDQDVVAGTLERWGKSRLLDELTQEHMLRPDVAAVLARRSGTPLDWPVMHAGILHTYGYLLSPAWTAFGWKRERWTCGTVASALDLDPRTLAADPPEGTLLGNLTAVLDSLLDHCDEPVLERSRFRISVITETPEGGHSLTVLRTYFVVGASRRSRNGESVLLFYTAQPSPDANELLVTAFPVTLEYRDALIDSCGDGQPIAARFNAATDLAPDAFGRRVHAHL